MHDVCSVEPVGQKEKFRLASEFTGDEGMIQASTWVQVIFDVFLTFHQVICVLCV